MGMSVVGAFTVNANGALCVSPIEIVTEVVSLVSEKVPPVMDKLAVALAKGTPWATSTTATPGLISLSDRFKGMGEV